MNALSNAEVEDVFPCKSVEKRLAVQRGSQVDRSADMQGYPVDKSGKLQGIANSRHSGGQIIHGNIHGGVDASLDSQLPAPARASAPTSTVGKMIMPGLNRNILALDLATVTGWAFIDRAGKHQGGSESFQPRPSWSKGQRALRFRQWLADLLTKLQPQVIAYEKVIRHSSNDAAHLYGLLEGLVHMAADSRNIIVRDVNVSIIKKEWTGSGNADKAAMVAEAKRRGFRPVDDNHADAIAILDWAVARELGKPLKYPPKPKAEKKKAFAERGVQRAKAQRKVKSAAAPQVSLL